MTGRVVQLLTAVPISLSILFAFVYTVNAGWYLQTTPGLAIAINEVYGDRLRAANIESMSIRTSWQDTLSTDYRITIKDSDGRVRKVRFLAPKFTTYRFHLSRHGDFFKLRSDHQDLLNTGEEDRNTIGPIVAMMLAQVEEPGTPLVLDFAKHRQSVKQYD